jgi:outer membrane immunogenic protein
MKMKKLAITLSALAALTGSAFAADMAPAPAPYAKAPVMVAPVANWTGCYIGAGWGYGVLDNERSGSDPTRPSSTSAAKGWLGSVGGGCDYQFGGGSPFGPIIIGAFADYDPSSIKGNFGDPFNDSHHGVQKMSDAWFAGARVGLLVAPNVMTYVNGGFTGAHFNQINIVTASGGTVDGGLSLPSQNANGWFLGSGIEYSFNFLPLNGLFWRNEYRYASYDNFDQHYTHPTFIGSSVVHNSIDVQTFTTSLVWRFNWTGPVAARY